MKKYCNYCGQEAIRVLGEDIYPHRSDLWDKEFWLCHPCTAYVECEGGGSLANYELREARKRAHSSFDRIWKYGKMSRTKAYSLLARKMGIKRNRCHIRFFDLKQCNEVLRVVKEWTY